MEKKWYKVSFFAPMTTDDVKAMNGSFYAAMEEMMNIYGCEGLSIKPDTTQQRFDPAGDEDVDLVLEEDSYVLDMKTGRIQIDKCMFDDFVKGSYIDIKFIDEDHEPINRYVMVEEDDEWIYCDFLQSLN